MGADSSATAAANIGRGSSSTATSSSGWPSSPKKDLEASGKLKKKRVVTEIVPAGDFFAAENHHQDYYLINPVRYKFYSYNCGRDQRLKELWGEAAAH